MKRSEELAQELALAKVKALALRQEVAAKEQYLESLKAELRLLEGSCGRNGKIRLLESRMAAALYDEAIRLKPLAVWLSTPVEGIPFYITRVTPKRIYVQAVGYSEEYYDIETGKHQWQESRLDAGACLAVWEAYTGGKI